jgi:Lon protease-like protein
MPLPLRVFEPRYRQLVAECLEADEPFGVALIREGVEVGGPSVPYEVGTTARILAASIAADGVLHIEAVGARRFRTLRLHDDRPYLWADVEYPVVDDVTAPAEAIEEAQAGLRLVHQLQARATGEFERAPAVPADAGALADAIASLGGAPPEASQALLELWDPAARLEAALPLLEPVLEASRRAADSAATVRWRGFGRTN